MTTYNTEDGGFLVEDNAGNQTIVENNNNLFLIIEQSDLSIKDTIEEARKNKILYNKSLVFTVNSLNDVYEYINITYGKPDENFDTKFTIIDNPDIKITPQVTINGNIYTKFVNIDVQPFGTITFIEKEKANENSRK